MRCGHSSTLSIVKSGESGWPAGASGSSLFTMDKVLLWPHLTFYTHEAMARLEDETLARCFEMLEGRPVLVKSHDPRLRAQRERVHFPEK